MKKPILVVMAGGLGSRYGGLKQIAPVDGGGHILMDYAIYDAKRAGFETVVCILGKGMEADFREIYGDRIERGMNLRIATQRIEDLPRGFSVPDGRTKPWGTTHAVLCARECVDAPFAVINADDFYGEEAFAALYNFLAGEKDEKSYSMIGYKLGNTLTEHGHVARGICKVENGELVHITEHTHLEKREGGAVSIAEDGASEFFPDETAVSMNMWGFFPSVMDELEANFKKFLTEDVKTNPMKSECFLPNVVGNLLREKKARVSVLPTDGKWYGVTWADDMPKVREALAAMREAGKYPELLWG